MSLDLGLFHVDVYPDGVRFEDVCSAISAAWLAGHRQLAKDIAQEYGLYDQVCLRCASSRISAAPVHIDRRKQFSDLLYQLCTDCLYAETLNERMETVRKTFKR